DAFDIAARRMRVEIALLRAAQEADRFRPITESMHASYEKKRVGLRAHDRDCDRRARDRDALKRVTRPRDFGRLPDDVDHRAPKGYLVFPGFAEVVGEREIDLRFERGARRERAIAARAGVAPLEHRSVIRNLVAVVYDAERVAAQPFERRLPIEDVH